MIIEDRRVVAFHYTLTNERGEELESSREHKPMMYLHGANNILPGLEKALAGKGAGDHVNVTLPPGYTSGRLPASRR